MNTRNTSDYYKVLNVADSASPEEIKRAYRSAARRYHPDTGGLYSSGKDFSNLNEAYRILSDPDLRRSYDLKLLRKRMSLAQIRVRAKTATDFNQSKARPDSESSAKSARFKVRKSGVGNEQGSSRVPSLSLWKKIKEKLKTLHRIPSYKRKVGAKAADKLLDHVVQIDALESIHGTIKEIEIVLF